MTSSPASRLEALKRRVGGNREKNRYESTYGPGPEERLGITPPGKSERRVLSELNFALQLSAAENGRFDREAEAALTLLEKAMDRDGVLTNGACAEAEAALLPAAGAAKEYALIYCGHAHIDMNWEWGWNETVATTLATFRTVLDLMEEYPSFTFMQSQASCYKIAEEYDPALAERIKDKIAERRWEVTAGAWVETDKNMPDTESLLRHIRLTRDYLQRVWGVEPASLRIDFSPDTFGHSRHIPELDRFSGLKYCYHCRGLQDDRVLYRYRAPSGKELLMYREPYWYNSGVNPDNGTGLIALSRICAGLKTGLIVYGVGDHGGGPTRRDIERVLEMSEWPVFPAIRFGRLDEFFALAEKEVGDRLETVEHELNAFAPGCYSTQSRIKRANRECERSLLDAERLCALGAIAVGVDYPREKFEQAWEKVLFTHFHDILTGSCVRESREYALGLYQQALAVSQTAEAAALRKLAEAIDTSAFICPEELSDTTAEGAGAGRLRFGVPNPERGVGKTRVYAVFNPASVDREENAAVTVWDYAGDITRLEALDAEGKPLELALEEGMPIKYWDHRYTDARVRVKVPALGYTVIVLRERELTEYETYRQHGGRIEPPMGGAVLENEYLRAELDNTTGMLTRLLDKKRGAELLSGPAGLYLIETEKDTSSAWSIGRYLNISPVTHLTGFRPFQDALTQGAEITAKVMDSVIKARITLDRGAEQLCFEYRIDWNEAANRQDTVPVLVFRMPAAGAPEQLINDVPAGFVTRNAEDADVPGLTFGAVRSAGGLTALIPDSKYGYRLEKGVLSCTLIQTAGNPDPYPERGEHLIRLWLARGEDSALSVKRRSEALNRPLIAMPVPARRGSLPPTARLMEFESDSCVLSAVELTGKGDLRFRIFETEGKPGTARVRAFGKELTVMAEPFSLAEAVLKTK